MPYSSFGKLGGVFRRIVTVAGAVLFASLMSSPAVASSVVSPSKADRESKRWFPYNQKPVLALLVSVFLFHSLTKTCSWRSGNKKPSVPVVHRISGSCVDRSALRLWRIAEMDWGCFTKESPCSLRSPCPFSLHGLSSKLEVINEKSPDVAAPY